MGGAFFILKYKLNAKSSIFSERGNIMKKLSSLFGAILSTISII